MRILFSLWHILWYIYGMKTTIDRAGRVVIPAAIRNRAGLKVNTELDVTLDDIGIRLVRAGPEPKLVRRGRRLIAKPVAKPEDLPDIDLAAMVEEERNRWPW
jgi:AbrB family looped-hinge helix DNA binding protein